jgi:hypothetical protein
VPDEGDFDGAAAVVAKVFSPAVLLAIALAALATL